MIFILFFGMTMRTFAWDNMGSLPEGLFEHFRIYYATPTQKSFFCQKKEVFFSCHASDFYYAILIFLIFGNLFLA
jgi:hypothetical protein